MCKAKKLILSGIIMIFATIGFAPVYAADFTDVKGHWAQNDIEWLADAGIVDGTMIDTFQPDRIVTRAEFAAMVVRTFVGGHDATPGISGLTDVKRSEWYADEVLWAEYSGWVRGYDDSTFRPDNPITREEAAAVLARIADQFTLPRKTADLSAFADVGTVTWSKDDVAHMVALTVLRGREVEGRAWIAPSSSITRAETVTLIARLVRYMGKVLPADRIAVLDKVFHKPVSVTPPTITSPNDSIREQLKLVI